MSGLGAFVAIWLGLLLTTPPAPFPLGLSFTQQQVSDHGVFLGNGWRIMYVIGAALTLLGGILIAVAGKPTAPTLNGTVALAFVGSIILFFGFHVWAPITYAWSAENFPTRADDRIRYR